jgi:hypothetical protein
MKKIFILLVLYSTSALANDQIIIDVKQYHKYDISLVKSNKPDDQGLFHVKLRIPPKINGAKLSAESIEIKKSGKIVFYSQLSCEYIEKTKYTFCEFGASRSNLKNLNVQLIYEDTDKGILKSYSVLGEDWLKGE